MASKCPFDGPVDVGEHPLYTWIGRNEGNAMWLHSSKKLAREHMAWLRDAINEKIEREKRDES